MLTLQLTGLQFYAYHGFYEEEKKLGGEFIVDVTVMHHPIKIPVKHLNETIDYTSLYQLVKEYMQQPTALLETIATTIAHEILTKFSQAEEVKISINKIHPPIIAFEGQVAVSCSVKRDNLLP